MRITVSELLQKFKKHPYISTDSRKVMPGSLFFALKGDNFDGNKFAITAIESGASYAIIDDPNQDVSEKTLLFDNVLDTLQQLASLYRSELKIPIIGITGTNGKTTTKELMSAVLAARFQTVATPGNLNNHIGVPLTLLSIKPDTEIAVIEMGANHVGEIEALCKIARPTHGLITNIGKAHLEGFGSFEGIVKAKNELYDYLKDNGGHVFVNSGNDLLMKLSVNCHRITYGTLSTDNVQGAVIESSEFLEVQVMKPANTLIKTKLVGSYNFENVLAALCVGIHMRLDLDKAVKSISDYKPGMNRSQVVKSVSNTLLLDAYNANPTSMKAAIENFNCMKNESKVVILGDMFELGKESEHEHQFILDLLQQMDFKRVFTAGPIFKDLVEKNKIVYIQSYNSTEELKQALSITPLTHSTILIKGSRGMKLESIVDIL